MSDTSADETNRKKDPSAALTERGTVTEFPEPSLLKTLVRCQGFRHDARIIYHNGISGVRVARCVRCGYSSVGYFDE